MTHKYKHSRGYLPHLNVNLSTQFVTFRLADSMPQVLLNKWRSETDSGAIDDVDFRKRIEYYLDRGYGSCHLNDRRIASKVRESLLHFDGERYRLVAWVIMPNHVHVLIELLDENELPDVMHSIKSYTAHEANKILKRSGQFWFVESFDRYIRHARHYHATVRYIENNPVKAGLCDEPAEWEFGSAFKG